MSSSRRDFIKKSAIGAAGITIGGIGLSAKSYGRIIGANDRLNFGIVGIHSRGKALLRAAAACQNTSIAALCDVDSRVLEDVTEMTKKITGKNPENYVDYRVLLENKDIDVVAIASPEHWHAPMAIMGAQAGKHVYVEKPCSHNPREGELLIEVAEKTGMKMQMGNQQRSAPTSILAIKEIKEGIIGEPYYGKAWYSNKRGPIGRGQEVPVPEWLNWELWQGPAPRQAYQDVWVHYDWHWFWEYGTGEINNNGTHEIDICRWALGVEYPNKISSAGGRYHYDDDWEFYDTQMVTYEYDNDKLITWEGKSCNPYKIFDRGRGAAIHGTEGTVILDRNLYQVFDLDGKKIKEVAEEEKSATTDTMGAGALDVYHMANLCNAIRHDEKLRSPMHEAAPTSTLCHLGNYAQKVGRTLRINKENGHILDDSEAMQLWSRVYEPGWEPRV